MVLEIRKGVEKLCNLLQNGDATFSIFICNFWYFYYAINIQNKKTASNGRSNPPAVDMHSSISYILSNRQTAKNLKF